MISVVLLTLMLLEMGEMQSNQGQFIEGVSLNLKRASRIESSCK